MDLLLLFCTSLMKPKNKHLSKVGFSSIIINVLKGALMLQTTFLIWSKVRFLVMFNKPILFF